MWRTNMNTELTFEAEPFDFQKQALDIFFEEDAFEYLGDPKGGEAKERPGPSLGALEVVRPAPKGTLPVKRLGVSLHGRRERPGGTVKATPTPLPARRSRLV